eukprot:359412-Chlamydomonas_euryale.AAC.2
MVSVAHLRPIGAAKTVKHGAWVSRPASCGLLSDAAKGCDGLLSQLWHIRGATGQLVATCTSMCPPQNGCMCAVHPMKMRTLVRRALVQ